ncbi:hypothetical protein D7X48_08900 [bacterium D16-50]|nr:hypothetical protein D7X48_08900 [bacterium D16-50]
MSWDCGRRRPERRLLAISRSNAQAPDAGKIKYFVFLSWKKKAKYVIINENPAILSDRKSRRAKNYIKKR